MSLTEIDALTAFAKTLNTLNAETLWPLLAEDFEYGSQRMLADVTSKTVFRTYFSLKLAGLRERRHPVFAELGRITAYGHEHCVILAQGRKDHLVGLVFADVADGFICRIDLCIVPDAHAARRSGFYPA
jgi:hypothetical protein